jgi:hypothetical protein
MAQKKQKKELLHNIWSRHLGDDRFGQILLEEKRESGGCCPSPAAAAARIGKTLLSCKCTKTPKEFARTFNWNYP